MAVNRRQQICATKRKRMVHDRKRKIVERRNLFYKHIIEDETSENDLK